MRPRTNPGRERIMLLNTSCNSRQAAAKRHVLYQLHQERNQLANEMSWPTCPPTAGRAQQQRRGRARPAALTLLAPPPPSPVDHPASRIIESWAAVLRQVPPRPTHSSPALPASPSRRARHTLIRTKSAHVNTHQKKVGWSNKTYQLLF